MIDVDYTLDVSMVEVLKQFEGRVINEYLRLEMKQTLINHIAYLHATRIIDTLPPDYWATVVIDSIIKAHLK